MLYVEVDAHKESSHGTVMQESGKVLKRRSIAGTHEGVRSGCAGQAVPGTDGRRTKRPH